MQETLNKYPFRPSYRVAVVGMGAVTPIGNNVATFWQGLLEGRSGIEKLSFLDPRVRCQIGGEVKCFDEKALKESVHPDPGSPQRKAAKRAERAGLLALAAVHEATAECKLLDELREETGLVLGSNVAGVELIAEATKTYYTHPPQI